MTGRIEDAQTPEGRLAAVCRTLMLRMEREALRRHAGPAAAEPDYADFRDTLRPFIKRELINALLDELQNYESPEAVFRRRDLRQQLVAVEYEIEAWKKKSV
jgi:hypothetical protein